MPNPSAPRPGPSVFGSLSASLTARATHRLDLGAGRSAAIWTNRRDEVLYDRPEGHTLSLYLTGGQGTRRLGARTPGAPVGGGRPGVVCVLPQGHSSRWAISDPFEFAHLYVPDQELRRAFSESFERDARLMDLPETTFADLPRLRLALERLTAALRAGEALAAEGAMGEALVAVLAPDAARADLRPRVKGGLAPHLRRRVEDYVEASLAEPIRLDDLARLAGLSAFHFQRMFRASFGLSPHGFTRRRRVERARLMLRTGEPIAAIAAACGFGDQSHLTRVFKSETGLTPAAYRAALRG